MSRIIVYGGAFNPPTNAHLAILEYLNRQANNAEVWLLLSGQRKDKFIETSQEKRIIYAKALIQSVTDPVQIKVITDELYQATPTETYKTVRKYEAAYPQTEFIWVFGSDSVQTMKTWRNGKWLYGHCKIWIIYRDGFTISDLPPHGRVIQIRTPSISSTVVRNRLDQGFLVNDLVPEKVNQLLV